MANGENLLDTPKKISLRVHSTELRAALKEFERAFAETHGRKPKQNDIKDDPTIAAKYKQYHKVSDVLAGKLSLEKLNEDKPRRRPQSSTHSRQSSSNQLSTPQKAIHAYETDPYDHPASISPKPGLVTVIGPTPHRDGKVVGLFDLLQSSDSKNSSTATPSSSARKRNLQELYEDTPARRSPLKVIQTPSHPSNRQAGDLLQFLAGTPQKRSGASNVAKHSRTPQSDGKRFQLSQFFATPSIQRFLLSTQDPLASTEQKTPLRDMVLGQTPQKQPSADGLDTTPAYFKRSTSFKDRLISVSQTSAGADPNKEQQPANLVGPPTLRHFRSSTSNTLKSSGVQKPPKASQRQPAEDSDHEDELEAMRELEAAKNDSHFDSSTPNTADIGDINVGVAGKPYKKKGQKRTTRKSTIRPIQRIKPTNQPTYVAADDFDGDDGETEEKNLILDDDNDDNDDDDDFDKLVDELEQPESSAKKRKTNNVDEVDKKSTEVKPQTKKQRGMINPNAQSHLNFRSLKIKNKNSKAKGAGKARFGRNRR